MTMLKRLSVALVALMLLLPWTVRAQTTTIDFWSFIDPAGANVRSKTLARTSSRPSRRPTRASR